MESTLYDNKDRKVLIKDGAIGTMFSRLHLSEADFRGERFADHPVDLSGNYDILSQTRPDAVTELHRQYIEAGADIICTDSFNANAVFQAHYGLEPAVREMNLAAARLARDAADREMETCGRHITVAGLMGPSSCPLSKISRGETEENPEESRERLVAAFRDQSLALLDGGVDILLAETAYDFLNLKALLEGVGKVAEMTDRTVELVVSMTLSADGRHIPSGETMEEVVDLVGNCSGNLKVTGIGLNCSFGPEAMMEPLERLRKLTSWPVICYPSAGFPDKNGVYPVTPERFAEIMSVPVREGWADIIGGCCGTTPAYIRALREKLSQTSDNVGRCQ